MLTKRTWSVSYFIILTSALGAWSFSVHQACQTSRPSRRSSARHGPSINMRFKPSQTISDDCDVAIIGAGIGGLCSAAVLSARYNLRVQVFESHYHIGGVAHSFRVRGALSGVGYHFDAGPTVMLGCSTAPYNPLRQVLDFVGSTDIEWLRYGSWGMCTEDGNWAFELGDGKFQQVLRRFAGPNAVQEFNALRTACEPLCAGAGSIPTVALRGGKYKLLPLLGHIDALKKVIPYSDTLNGSFKQLLEAHVKDPWLKSWLDALAFSLSGLPAADTGAAALAYTLYDLHRDGSSLDYPKGGMGRISEVLAEVIQSTGGAVFTSKPVKSIVVENGRAAGVALQDGRYIKAKKAVICNANIWALPQLLQSERSKLNEDQQSFFFRESAEKKVTKSFMHLHLGMDASGLDLSKMQPHYTVMDQGLYTADPCADRNMVAVSNPSVLDDSLVEPPSKTTRTTTTGTTITSSTDTATNKNKKNKRIIVHAYGAGNEPWELWKPFTDNDCPSSSSTSSSSSSTGSIVKDRAAYEQQKEQASEFLFRSVSRALCIPIEEVKTRAEVTMTGSPITHARFTRRYVGTYGAAFDDMLPDSLTPLRSLYLCGDSVFPGIGVPAVAVSGCSAAHTTVNVARHLLELSRYSQLK